MRRLAIAIAVALVTLLAGCADLADSDQRRLCRSLLPAVDVGFDRFDIVRTEDLSTSPADGIVLRIVYRAETRAANAADRDQQRRRVRTLICSFAPAAAGALPVLASVVSDRGPLGPARLYILQRYWIDSGLATRADPAPVAMLALAPDLPRLTAFGLQTLLGSLPVIAIYALLATSYALIYGLIGRINLAFGELASLAGYGGFLGFSMIGDGNIRTAVLLALVAGCFTAVVHGGALGRLVLGPLAPSPGQHILIATIGVSIFWQEAMRLTQGAGNRWISPLMNRPIGVARAADFAVTVTPMALVVALAAAMAVAALVIAMRRSRFGRLWRASADDVIAASLFGVAPQRILLATMVIAALMCGLSGILTTFYYGGVGYSGGLVIGLKALIAAIVGGIGSIEGALVGALLIGLGETLWSGIFPIEYRDPALFISLVIVLWLKPSGMFGDAQSAPTNRR